MIFLSACMQISLSEFTREDSTSCFHQQMHLQMKTLTSKSSFEQGFFEHENEIKLCLERGELQIFTAGVEKYSFSLSISPGHETGSQRVRGFCSSGRRVEVSFKLQGERLVWLRLMYPDYRFLHIFAIDADKLKEAVLDYEHRAVEEDYNATLSAE